MRGRCKGFDTRIPGFYLIPGPPLTHCVVCQSHLLSWSFGSFLNGRIGLDDFKVSFSTDILQVSHHPEALRVRTPLGETLRIEVLGAFLGFSSSPLCL